MQRSKIKIFVDCHCFDSGYQGTQTFVRGLYNCILKSHPQLEIYFGARHLERVREAFPLAGTDRFIAYRSTTTFRRIVFEIPDILRRCDFDYAHFQNISPFTRERCRFIVTLHDNLYDEYPQYFSSFYRLSRTIVFRKSIHLADIKTTVSEFSRKSISRRYKIAASNLHTLPNGVALSNDTVSVQVAWQYIEARFGIRDYILCVSRIEPRKNQAALLRAWKDLKLYEKGIALVLIGITSIPCMELMREIDTLLPEQRQWFYHLTEVSDRELALFYQGCRLFVYPSLAEGFGIPPLEAAASGVPVLCSNTTAMSDYSFFGTNHFNPTNYLDLLKLMTNIIHRPPTANSLRAIARCIQSKYSWENTARTFFDIIKTHACRS